MNFTTGTMNTKTASEILADSLSMKKLIVDFAPRNDRLGVGRRPMDILDGLGSQSIGGMDYIVDKSMDDQARMTVTQKFADLMPAEFVADLNAWMLEFFGRENRVYCLHGNTLILGPKTLAAMEREL
jgi:hypothetical protein